MSVFDGILLDMTRAVERRWAGRTPSGIDRVCDAYAAHLGTAAFAVIQLGGVPLVLGRSASAALHAALGGPKWQFRRTLLAILAGRHGGRLESQALAAKFYLNAGHSGFDRAGHRRWIDRHRLRAVYFLHDLIPALQPEVTTPHKAARHRGRADHAIAHAAGIVVSTQAVAGDLVQYTARQGSTLPPVLAASIAGARLPVPLRRDRPERTLFVSVGTIEQRKNHSHLLRVWQQLEQRLGDRTPDLVLAGAWGRGSGTVKAMLARDPALSRRVIVASGLDDAALARLLSGARGVVLPTLAEGFGLPLTEALALGVPVIASDLPCLREVGQGVPHLLDPGDCSGWADAVADFCIHGPLWQRQQAALPAFREPTWPDHFAALEQWLGALGGAGLPARIPAGRDGASNTAAARARPLNRDGQW